MAYDRSAVKLLPRSGARIHPFLLALKRSNMKLADLARALNVTPQSVAVWKRECIERPNYLLPAERVPALSVALGVTPHTLRPDLYKPEWTFA
jgi:hypothetical protein